MIEQIFNTDKEKLYEVYRDTSSWEEFDAYLRNLPYFKVMEIITEDESKLLYTLVKGEEKNG